MPPDCSHFATVDGAELSLRPGQRVLKAREAGAWFGARELLREARERAKAHALEAKEAGYAAGVAAARSDMSTELAAAVRAADEVTRTAEAALAQAMIAALGNVFGEMGNSETLARLAARAVPALPATVPLQLRVHPANVSAVREALHDMDASGSGSERIVEVTAEADMSRDVARLQCSTATVELGLEDQLDALRRALVT